jgi:iron-sulfur cluster assembly 1
MSLRPPSLQPQPSQPPSLPDVDQDLDLTIRFSASLPDLLLSIPASLNANTATLKQLIRSRLPDENAKHRIRLIHAGKALVDEVPLLTSLRKKTVSRPPSRLGTPSPYEARSNGVSAGGQGDARGKGKQPLRDPPAAQARIYIHCSIGDIVLSPKELADEAALAAAAQPTDKQTSAIAEQATTTTPAPRGFDRLLHAGFTAAEVQSLRLQFLAIQAHTHTPDTMPSPAELRDLEDRWLDNSNAAGDLDAAAGGSLGAGDDDVQAGALDDMIWGTAMGFFWPVGCLMWGVRESGIWSQRRKMAVVVGFLLNVGLGLIRYGG